MSRGLFHIRGGIPPYAETGSFVYGCLLWTLRIMHGVYGGAVVAFISPSLEEGDDEVADALRDDWHFPPAGGR